ncbi:branched-chain amino acid ABC transporter permease [Desulfatibacillum aliphaticivorans]|uniref:branched-chain amino acid ABC transporter permease n=1 Tax=Desulfatibacillum aliphaticivorans TaxID=218208 RepID=UPI000407DE76|nr:branched-chain amino acid ABC transporter permease [Desulfatibacillum aliphaticivorans]
MADIAATEQTPVSMLRREQRKKRYYSIGIVLPCLVLAMFALIPFLSPSYKTLDLALKIIIFASLVASFDIMLGYTGILSFGHGMFFGIGAYCVAFLNGKYGDPTYFHLFLGLLLAVAVACVLALIVSLISLRVKAIFFAMITLALAELTIVLANKLSHFTGGEDGISISLPGIFSAAFNPGSFLGLDISGRVITYYFILLACLGLFALMLRFTHSPLGRVLQAIRDNTDRAEALGYKTFYFQTLSIVLGCTVAAMTGGLYAMWVGYVNPESTLEVMAIMLNVLLMVIIGGMGTLYGGIVGAAFLLITQTFLPDLQKIAIDLFPNASLLHTILERWLLLFGILFILVVIFFPKGVVGSAREFIARARGEAFFSS